MTRRNAFAACALLLASGARAQLTALRVMSAPPVAAAPAALSAGASALASSALPMSFSAAVPAPLPAPDPVPAAEAPVEANAATFSSAQGLQALAAAPPAASNATFDGGGASGGANAPPPAAPVLQRVKTLDLHPTQMAVGMREVARKADKLSGKKPEKVDDWLKDHAVPVVLGPGGRMYMIDHHHEARAAWDAGIKEMYMTVKADLSGLSESDFWKRMNAQQWVYLYDQFGKGPHAPSELPTDVRGLADDPYRSVSGAVRDAGGYEKTLKPFSEFLWAQFFRTRVALAKVASDFDGAVAQALLLAKTAAAKDLPGWLGAAAGSGAH